MPHACVGTQTAKVNHVIISQSKPNALNKLFLFNYIVQYNQIRTQEVESKDLIV